MNQSLANRVAAAIADRGPHTTVRAGPHTAVPRRGASSAPESPKGDRLKAGGSHAHRIGHAGEKTQLYQIGFERIQR